MEGGFQPLFYLDQILSEPPEISLKQSCGRETRFI
jgi:hypothetical protein